MSTVAGMPGRSGVALGALPGALTSPPAIAVTGADTFALTSGNLVLELDLPRR